MATYYPGDTLEHATHGDIVVSGYGERLRIIEEFASGKGFVAINDMSGLRRVILRATESEMITNHD